MPDDDFPSRFEPGGRHERAVDDRSRREEQEVEVAVLRAEVERLRADRAALFHRLEELMDRWHSERNALVRALAVRAIGGDRRARAETLLRCIEELDGAIPGG